MDVVAADHAHILGHPLTATMELVDGTDGHLVVAGEDRRETGFTGEELFDGLLAALFCIQTVGDEVLRNLRAGFSKGFDEGASRIEGGLDFDCSTDHTDPPVTEIEEVARRQPRRGGIVADDVIQAFLCEVVVDDEDGILLPRQIVKEVVLLVGADEEKAVNETLVEELHVSSLTDEGGRSDFEENLVSETVGFVVDAADQLAEVDVREGMFEIGDKDREDAATPVLEALGEAIGSVSEALDGGQDASARGLADPLVALVQDERDGRQRDAALPRNLTNADGTRTR